MVPLKSLVEYCNDLLSINEFRDYCPNGLQVEGVSTVKKLVCGVTACQDLIEAAIDEKADALLVHHGYFWKNEQPVITGIKRKRIQRLLEHNISLLTYHLPLDAHSEFGNNVTLARKLAIQIDGCVQEGDARGLLWYGTLPEPQTASLFAGHVEQVLLRKPLHLPAAQDKPVQRIGWCTGGAQHYIEQAAELALDAFLSGEVSEQTRHLAKELDIHYFAAGHHATESYGVQALATHLASQFDLQTLFINIDNPV